MAKKSRSRSRRQPNRRVVVASAAVAVAAVASANTAVTAFAFSPPLAPRATLSSREGHCSANYSNNVNFIRRCAATTASASTVSEDFQQRGPLHVNYCGLPQIIMQNEQQKQQQWSALVGKSNVRRSSLSSLSGQYGGFGSSLDNTNNNGSLRKDSELSVSRSSDNVLGFRVEDFEQFDSHTGFAPSDNNDVDDELNELSYRAEDFEHYQAQQRQTSSPTDLKIRKLNPRKASATKNRAAASLFRSRPDGSTVTSSSAMGSKKTKSNAKNKKDDVPPWLPWIPTESQIMAMKVVELRAACAERGLVMVSRVQFTFSFITFFDASKIGFMDKDSRKIFCISLIVGLHTHFLQIT